MKTGRTELLEDGLAARIAAELDLIGKFGKLVLIVVNGVVVRVEGTRSTLIADETEGSGDRLT